MEIDSEKLIGVIGKIADQRIEKNSNNLEYSYFGFVESANGTRFNVRIPSEGSIYPNLLNQTGTNLNIGDSVIVRAKGNKAGNAYIAVKNGATNSGGSSGGTSGNYIPIGEKGAAHGVATLDENKVLPANQIPNLNYISNSQKGNAGGVASLDVNGRVPEWQLPPNSGGSGNTIQLDPSVTSTSTATAATSSAVKQAYDLAASKQSSIVANGVLKGNGVGGVSTATADDFPIASTSQKGVVQLEDNISSTSTNLAATANAVKKVKEIAENALPQAEKGVAGGLATLGDDGKLCVDQRPDGSLPDANNLVGIVPVNKGGTGKNEWQTNRLIYPTANTTLGQMPVPTNDKSTLMQDKSGAPYWAAPNTILDTIGALSKTHLADKINSADGVHGIRYFGGKLEYKNESIWTEIKGQSSGGGSDPSPKSSGAVFVVGTKTNGHTASDVDFLCTGSNDQKVINAAIQALPDSGGEIIIKSGDYYIWKSIVINKPKVILRGENEAKLINYSFWELHMELDTKLYPIIDIEEEASLRIEQVILSGLLVEDYDLHGIYAQGSLEAQNVGFVFLSCGIMAIPVFDNSFNAVYKINECIFSLCGVGISFKDDVDDLYDIQITNCMCVYSLLAHINNCRVNIKNNMVLIGGILIENCSFSYISENTLLYTTIAIEGGTYITIRNNAILHHDDYEDEDDEDLGFDYVIKLKGGSFNNITNNIMSYAHSCIQIEQSHTNIISDNICTAISNEVQHSVYLDEDSSNNMINNNLILSKNVTDLGINNMVANNKSKENMDENTGAIDGGVF